MKGTVQIPINMAEEGEKVGKAEEVSEETSKLVGKGLKKGVKFAKRLGKAIEEGFKGEEEK